MQERLVSFLIIFFFQPLFCMEEIQECVNTLKPFLDNKELSLNGKLIDTVKKNSTISNVCITIKCMAYLIETNNNNPHALDCLPPFLFNEETINEKIDKKKTPLDFLAFDTNAFNSALYKIRGTKNIAKTQYNLIFKITDILNEKFIHVITPLDKEDHYTDYVRINGINFVTHYNMSELNHKELFLKINSIKDTDEITFYDTQPNKIEYWKESFLPTFSPEVVSNIDFCMFEGKIICLLCCLKAIKKNNNITTVKQVINNHIIPFIDSDILTNQCTVVYNDMQEFIKKIKIASAYALNKFGIEQYSFFINDFNPWHKAETQKLISFENVKKLFAYHNKKKK